jgi:integrase
MRAINSSPECVRFRPQSLGERRREVFGSGGCEAGLFGQRGDPAPLNTIGEREEHALSATALLLVSQTKWQVREAHVSHRFLGEPGGIRTHDPKRGKSQKAWAEARKRIDLIFSSLMDRPAETLNRQELQMIADAYASQSSAAYAVRSLRPALKWAAQRGYIPEDAARLHPPVPVKRRKRVLARGELQALLPVLRDRSRPYAAALRFMLLTLARRDEAALARWRDVDLTTEIWTIPETNNGEPHLVPLSKQALSLLDGIRPSEPKPDSLIFATRTGARLRNWDRETKAFHKASGTSGWTRHDLRRTGATMLGEMGELPDIIEAALESIRDHIVL